MSDEITPTQLVVYSIEALLGLFLLWRFQFSRTARERRSSIQPLPHWDIPGYAFAMAAFRVIGIGIVVQIITVQIVDWCLPALDADARMLAAAPAFHGGILLGLAVAWFLQKSARFAALVSTTGTTPPPQPLALRWVPLAGLATFLVTITLTGPITEGWTYLLERLGFPTHHQDAVELFANTKSATGLFLLIFMAVVLAPLSEELAFRAGVFRFARNRLSRTLAFAVPAALFAGLHRNAAVFPALFLMGIIHSLAYERTGRIAVPVVAHAAFNLNTVVLLFLK